MRIWDQGQPGDPAGTGRGKGIESNHEAAEEVHGLEGVGTKHGFWGGAASACMLTSSLEPAFQGPGTAKAAGPQRLCYGKVVSFPMQLFCLSRGSSSTSETHQDITKEN